MSEQQLDALNVKPELPFGLRQAIDSGTCVLFLGAGIGRHLLDADGKHAPTGWELAEEIAQHFKIDSSDELDLARAAQIVEFRKGHFHQGDSNICRSSKQAVHWIRGQYGVLPPKSPTDSSSPLFLEGTIAVVKAGYALIDVDGYRCGFRT